MQELDFTEAVPVAWLIKAIGRHVPSDTGIEAVIEGRTGRYLPELEFAVTQLRPDALRSLPPKGMPTELRFFALGKFEHRFDAVECCCVVVIEMSDEVPFDEVQSPVQGMGA